MEKKSIRRGIRHEIDGAFVLLLFAIFAGCVLMVLLMGASAYEKMVARDNIAYNKRTGVNYIAAKIRHNDEKDSVYVGSFYDKNDDLTRDIDTLYLKLKVEDEEYYTKIYYYDGYIR